MITARRYLPNSPKYDTAKFVRLAGKIVNLLNAQWDAKIKDVDHFEIFQQPKDVKVTRDFAIGKCQLPVTTTKVYVGDKLESNPSHVMLGDWTFGDGKYQVALMAGTVWPKADSESPPPAAFISPFWILRHSRKKDECNMELVYDKGSRKPSLDTALSCHTRAISRRSSRATAWCCTTSMPRENLTWKSCSLSRSDVGRRELTRVCIALVSSCSAKRSPILNIDIGFV